MQDEYTRGLERNIGKYAWFKIFSKRVYLPLIIIYLASHGVSTQQIGFIAFISTVTTIALQIPTGYLADKLGARKVIVTGTFIGALSPIIYILSPNFLGGMVADILFWAGFAFQSGAIEAFIHDTLAALGKEKSYTKVMGHAQSYGLIGNVVLISLIPLTYPIDKRLPFVIGAVSLFINFLIALNFTYPKRKIEVKKPNPFEALRKSITPTNASVFVLAGAMTAALYRGQEFRELVFQDVGIPVRYFGIILACSSVLAAVLGRLLHHTDRISANTFYFLNVVGLTLLFTTIGLTRNPVTIVAGFVLLLAYARVQMIVITSKLLQSIKHGYKSTLISSLTMAELLEELWVISLLTGFVTTSGYVQGYFNFGVTFGVIGLILFAAHLLIHKKYTLKTD
jgi:MFS family permease